MYNKKIQSVTTLLVAFLLVPMVSQAQLSSGNYQVDVFGVGSAGNGTATSSNYTAESNIGPDFEYDEATTTPTSNSGGGGGGGSSNNDDSTDETTSAPEDRGVEDGPASVLEKAAAADAKNAADAAAEAGNSEQESDTPADPAEDESDLILEERIINYEDTGEYLSVTEEFDDGLSITMGVFSGAILDENGNQVTDDIELRIILRVKLLASKQTPDNSLLVALQGGKLFELLVVDQFGTKYTTFDPALDVSITLPPEMMTHDDVGLYFYDEEKLDWEQIVDAVFEEGTVSFQTNHLTTFGVWGGEDISEQIATEGSIALTDTDRPGCSNFFVCYWWVLVIIGIVGIWLYRRRTAN